MSPEPADIPGQEYVLSGRALLLQRPRLWTQPPCLNQTGDVQDYSDLCAAVRTGVAAATPYHSKLGRTGMSALRLKRSAPLPLPGVCGSFRGPQNLLKEVLTKTSEMLTFAAESKQNIKHHEKTNTISHCSGLCPGSRFAGR